jgi:hypothetical protein
MDKHEHGERRKYRDHGGLPLEIPDDLLAELERYAASRGMAVNDLILWIVRKDNPGRQEREASAERGPHMIAATDAGD